jgi:hypothetical protein
MRFATVLPCAPTPRINIFLPIFLPQYFFSRPAQVRGVANVQINYRKKSAPEQVKPIQKDSSYPRHAPHKRE